MTKEELIAFEAEVAAAFNAGKICAPIHLHGGNEDQLIEIFQDIADEDWICTNWRSHYHCLLKGVPPDELMAKILAGSSITLNFPEYGIVSSAIVGGSLSIGLGIALGIKLDGGKEFVHCFLGDMTACGGSYHHVVQFSLGHALPMRFIIEDNGLSVCTPTRETWGITSAWALPNIHRYSYTLPWPHSGAGVRVQF